MRVPTYVHISTHLYRQMRPRVCLLTAMHVLGSVQMRMCVRIEVLP